jgi:hypothetical protein
MRASFLFFLLLLCVGGCSSQEDKSDKAQSPVVSTVVLQGADTEPATGSGPKARLKKEVLIGGCQSACENHEQAFRAYLTAAFDGVDGQGTIPFLETSEMVHNGVKRGSAWVELWRERKLEQRRNEIAAFADQVHQWVRLSKRDELEVSLANHVTFTEDDGPGFLAYYKPPGTSLRPDDLKEWRFRIQKRGWEWLISEMTTQTPQP